ncbi:hypothetical protein [Paenibacillus humicola]|uniref:hypothetical protein n=1 Tax=Paenibacillus humicola TaxID=3110540 RepID=UPI00237C2720|nr:hypothetical protein [Paenibacillus humicola]
MKRTSTIAAFMAAALLMGSGIVTGQSVFAAAAQHQTNTWSGGSVRAGGMSMANDELAKLLGMTTAELQKELASGKSLAAIAKAKGISAQKVTDLLVKDRKARLEDLLKSKKITQAQFNKMSQQLTNMAEKSVNGTMTGHAGGRAFAATDELAKLLGTTKTELQKELSAGKTLAAIAKAKGVAVQKVVDTLVKSKLTALDTQLKNKKITQTQYNTMKARLSAAAAAFVNGKK